MENKVNNPSLQDYSLISTTIKQYEDYFGVKEDSIGFMLFALDSILGLPDDECEDAITDNFYLFKMGKSAGHDRGIDALYIDETEKPAVVHLFNMKYVTDFKKATNFFPSAEIDKILNFLGPLISHEDNLCTQVNKHLAEKIQEIWQLFTNQNPKFVIHICSNLYNSFENLEKDRFESSLKNYSGISTQYHNIQDFVERLTKEGKIVVNAKIRAIDQNLFEKSDGDIRALVVDIDSRELLRIVSEDEGFRNDVSLANYDKLLNNAILEDAFEDNVRVYLKLRSRINRNIKETALSDDAHRFFYFNNGITLTCSRFEYPKNLRNPIIEIKNLQIVNGSQTIHALYDAYSENEKKFENIEILLRIYETQKEDLSTKIAEYTNSQNPVSSRDMRSNDYTQKKLEKELDQLGYFYERKKRQYFGKPKRKRIDAEKAGQALFAFYVKMPAEAKNQKKLIFAEKYEEIFSDTVTANEILTAVNLYWDIEEKKNTLILRMEEEDSLYESESFIRYASYYILYGISELADLEKISKKYENFSQLVALYTSSIELIKKAIKEEKDNLAGHAKYLDADFFKTNKPKLYIQKYLGLKQ